MVEGIFEEISEAIQSFEEEKVFNAVKKALSLGVDASEIIEKGIAKGLKIVGDKYERGELFLMHLVAAAEPAQKAVKELLEPEIKKKAGERKSLGKIVIGTVQGDIHDIGKNIVAAMLFAAGFEVIDLGKDVPAEEFAKKAKEVGANIVGASALLSTTLPVQKEIIEALKAIGIRNKVKTIFGGAPCTAEWVEEIGGDGYAENAIEAVKTAKRLIGAKD
ncbi:corrinoid protein [Candidatus Bathyarchaeota archaeon]|nr:corrinoid protein [Candidatus Bathyarchaeota archaeon]